MTKAGEGGAKQDTWRVTRVFAELPDGGQLEIAVPAQDFSLTDAGEGGAPLTDAEREGRAILENEMIDAYMDTTPMVQKVAMTGTVGLVIGGLMAFVLNRLMRSNKPAVYHAVMKQLKHDKTVKNLLGDIQTGAAHEHKILGLTSDKNADFYFQVGSTPACGATMVHTLQVAWFSQGEDVLLLVFYCYSCLLAVAV
jgi:hypothetical protein